MFNGDVIAESDDVVRVEGNAYFPLDAVRADVLQRSRAKTVCPWKGVASYYSVEVDGLQARNVAWTYRHPSPFARRIKNRVAFGPFVEIVDE